LLIFHPSPPGFRRINAFLHAALCLGAAAYSLFLAPSNKGRLFAFDRTVWQLMDTHAGFLIYELLFYTNNAALVPRPLRFLFLHHALLLGGMLITKIYPCALTLRLLPWYQLMGVAAGIEGMHEVVLAMGSPLRVYLRWLMAMTAAAMLRVAGGASLAVAAMMSLLDAEAVRAQRSNEEAAAVVFTRPYAIYFLGGTWTAAYIYWCWFSEISATQAAVFEELRKRRSGGKDKKEGRRKK
jgi:hypothetical protein